MAFPIFAYGCDEGGLGRAREVDQSGTYNFGTIFPRIADVYGPRRLSIPVRLPRGWTFLGRCMKLRVKIAIALTALGAGLAIRWAAGAPMVHWERFLIYLALVLLASGMKVPMPKGDGTLSLNFPIILLAIVQLSPLQAIMLAAVSVFAQCRFRVLKAFTLVQIGFNVSNAVLATSVACVVYLYSYRLYAELAPALCFAVTAYFLANSVPVALVIGWSSGEEPYALWKREFPWYLPIYIVGAVVAAAAHFISIVYGLTTSLLVLPVIYTLYRSYRTQRTMLSDRQRHLTETEALHLRTIEGLAMAIEAKDQNTHDHLLRVRVYVQEIGVALELDPLQMQALETAAFLHDIGKLAVPEHIVNKPGKLTHEEFEKMKIHPVVGADILERMRFPYPVAPIVRSHHESWDGTGYPDGLAGRDIPIGARILSVVDCFDALASNRPYRKAMPLEEAMALVRSKSGQQFDPAVVEVLGRMYLEMEERARARRGDIAPLETEPAVWRGLAPGNGFAEDDQRVLAAESQSSEEYGSEPEERAHRNRALRLIAAASEEAQTLFEMSQMLGNSLSTNETISVMSSRLKRLIPFRCFAVYLRHQDMLSPQYIDGEAAASFSKALLPLGEGISGWVAQSGKPLLNGDASLEPNYDATREVAGEVMCSALSLPLFDLNREVFGVLTVYAPELNVFSRDHLRILQAVEAKFSLSMQNALRFRSAEKEATIDYITQLPNMRQFFLAMEVQLGRAARTNRDLCVLVCDLNSFKAVNDRYGHLTGNLLLRSIADGSRKICRSFDTVARMGGDEFVFLLPGVDGDCSAQLAAIDEVVQQACREHELEVEVSFSVGVAFYPQDGATAEELLGVADRRMYLHKRTHGGPGKKDRMQRLDTMLAPSAA